MKNDDFDEFKQYQLDIVDLMLSKELRVELIQNSRNYDWDRINVHKLMLFEKVKSLTLKLFDSLKNDLDPEWQIYAYRFNLSQLTRFFEDEIRKEIKWDNRKPKNDKIRILNLLLNEFRDKHLIFYEEKDYKKFIEEKMKMSRR